MILLSVIVSSISVNTNFVSFQDSNHLIEPAGAQEGPRTPPQSPNDTDGDGVSNEVDNCPDIYNPSQDDQDGDGIGLACEQPTPYDADGDEIPNESDNCPQFWNNDQRDDDGDWIGDECDPDRFVGVCWMGLGVINPNTTDCESPLPPEIDGDGDGVPDEEDNCPDEWNPMQINYDALGIGLVCDDDGDGVSNEVDNCPDVSNFSQRDFDGDGIGYACDPQLYTPGPGDTDGDGIPDEEDNCPDHPNPIIINQDGDLSVHDACEDSFLDDPNDTDGDGIPNEDDNCPEHYVPYAISDIDTDGDGIGDACDPDRFVHAGTLEPQCLVGYVWNGIECQPAQQGPVPECPPGYVWNGVECKLTEPDPQAEEDCPAGTIWNGRECVTIGLPREDCITDARTGETSCVPPGLPFSQPPTPRGTVDQGLDGTSSQILPPTTTTTTERSMIGQVPPLFGRTLPEQLGEGKQQPPTSNGTLTDQVPLAGDPSNKTTERPPLGTGPATAQRTVPVPEQQASKSDGTTKDQNLPSLFQQQPLRQQPFQQQQPLSGTPSPVQPSENTTLRPALQEKCRLDPLAPGCASQGEPSQEVVIQPPPIQEKVAEPAISIPSDGGQASDEPEPEAESEPEENGAIG